MKVVIVHDGLHVFGGGERVLTALTKIFPRAPICTSVIKKKIQKRLNLKNKIIPSWFNKLPFSAQLISPMRFVLPFVWESFDLSEYDLVITSSGALMAHSVLVSPKTKLISYVHTPPRRLYGYHESQIWRKYFLTRAYAKITDSLLRVYDYYSAQKADKLIANSRETAKRIKKYWKRESQVIYPPVKSPQLTNIKKPKLNTKFSSPFYLVISRLQYMKRIDLIIKAFNSLKKPLVIIGEGRQAKELKKINLSPLTCFTGFVPDENLPWFYRNAKAFIFASENEDFGIAPIEAQAYGLPTIAHYSGGPKETIIDGRTGSFFKKHTVKSLLKAIKRLDKYLAKKQVTPQNCRRNAQKYSEKRFINQMKKAVKKLMLK